MMTKDQATARKAALMRDHEWVKRYTIGGSAETNELTALNQIITGTAPTAMSERDQAEARKQGLTKDRDWVARYLNGGVAETQEMDALNKAIVGS
jgi:hypothetical protein